MIPALAERGGLFIIKHGIVTEYNRFTLQDLIDGKLPVLGQCNIIPAVLHQLGIDDVSRSLHARGNVHVGSAAALEATAVCKIQTVHGGHEIGTEILGISEGRDNTLTVARDERIVHLFKIVLIQNVIRVEQEEAVVILHAVVTADTVEQMTESVPHGTLFGIVILIYGSSCTPRDLCRLIGTVMCYDKNLQFILRVIALLNTFNELADHCLFVSGRNNYAVAQLLLGVREGFLFENAHNTEKHEMDGEKQHDHVQGKGHAVHNRNVNTHYRSSM